MPDLALGIELARAFGKVIASHLAGAAIDALSLTPGLGCRAAGGAELDRGVIGFQRAHDLRLVAARRARERGARRRAGRARVGVHASHAAAEFFDGKLRGLPRWSLAPGRSERESGEER